MKTRTKWQAAVAGILCVSAIGTAVAQESPWLVRARAVRLNWANKSDAGFNSLTPALLPADAVQVNKKFIP